MEEKKYNYHSHTYRCGHAADIADNVYLNNAIEHGFNKYGITDHVPVYPLFYTDSSVRMDDIHKEEYLKSMRSLKEQYKEFLNLYYGFEAEYDEIIEEYLCYLRDESDYMIMGQHYVLNKDIRNSPIYPYEYAKKVCNGIKSGIFDIVAHPDIFMQYRRSMITEEARSIFDRNALLAAEMICSTAKEYGVPLELNLGATHPIMFKIQNFSEDDLKKDYIKNFLARKIEDDVRYPTKLFWDVVIEHENDVVVGIDAHYPSEIGQREEKLEMIGTYIDLFKLKFLPNDYDPVTARRNNLKLQDAYNETKRNLTSVESRLLGSLIDELCQEQDLPRVDKNKLKTAIIRTLRSEPQRKFKLPEATDELTYDRRENLVDVVKSSFRGMKSKKKLSFREIKETLLRDVEFVYGGKKMAEKTTDKVQEKGLGRML